MPRVLIIAGLILVVAGLLWPLLKVIGFGSLPGDITIKRDNFLFHFPITTMIIISVMITVILNILLKLFK
ncbi:MAG TPA: DUF2905 domain-containing protein [Nitrospinota bacterium]|jgi:hypothetical protein|nr:DUF2905 domain-containing protein [Nitrospinota bacterium]|tara:strand:- start:94850 stop:95059 length:210 start_codon:yes stop_codon:yes gene_type:complete